MRDTLIGLETAKLAKDKGYFICSEYSYWIDVLTYDNPWYNDTKKDLKVYNKHPRYFAPTQTVLQKWLREKHNLHIWILPYGSNDQYNVFVNRGFNLDLATAYNIGPLETYEEALEAGLQEALNYLP